MLKNKVRERLAAGQPALGLMVRMARTGDIARIAAATDNDFLYIDQQHSALTLENVNHIIQAALGCGVAPFVRVRGVSDPNIGPLLDCGALGIVVPNVETAQEARDVVAATKFPPQGRRSFGGAGPHYENQELSAFEFTELANRTVMTFCMIETVTGLHNVEEIAAVKGLDGLYLGANDMMASFRTSGNPDDKFSLDLVLGRIVAVAKKHGLVAGCGGLKDADARRDAFRAGVRFLTHQTDVALVMAGATAEVQAIRAT